MIETLKLVANWGFPAVLCIYLIFNFGKKLDKLDNTIGNHLTHALEENTKVTQKNSESSDKIETAMEKVSNSMDKLSDKIVEFINRK